MTMYRVEAKMGGAVVSVSPQWAESDNEACAKERRCLKHNRVVFDSISARPAKNIYDAEGL